MKRTQVVYVVTLLRSERRSKSTTFRLSFSRCLLDLLSDATEHSPSSQDGGRAAGTFVEFKHGFVYVAGADASHDVGFKVGVSRLEEGRWPLFMPGDLHT